MRSLAALLHFRPSGVHKEDTTMGYIIAWLLGVPVTLLLLFWLFLGR
jgi:hypothetical protein